MSTAVSVSEALIKLIPVIAGAVLALSGAGIKYIVDRRDRRKQIRREKLESLMTLVYQLKRWTGIVDDRYIFRTSEENIPLPTDQIAVISTLYFSELNDRVNDVLLAAKKYQKFAIDMGTYRHKNNGQLPETYVQDAAVKYDVLLARIEALTDEAKAISKEFL